MSGDRNMASLSCEGVEYFVTVAKKLSNAEPFPPVLPGQANCNNGHDSLNWFHVSARDSLSKDCLESKANVSFLDLQEAMKANEEETIRMEALIAEKKLDSGDN